MALLTRAAHLEESPPELYRDAASAAAPETKIITRVVAEAFARLNRRFHSLLCDTEHSRLTHRMLQGLWARTETAQRGFRLVPWRLPKSHAEHVAIRDALVAGDIALASRLVYRRW